MTRRNATDAVAVFRNAAKAYRDTYLPRIQAIRQRYSNNPAQVLPDEISIALEAHGRNYLIDSLLAALNWNITSKSGAYFANMIPEAPLQSVKDEERRYIDYFGVDRETQNPLLIVEAKRPGSPLPSRADLQSVGSRKAIYRENESIAEILIDALAGTKLKYDWSAWIEQVTDYVKSVYEHTKICPKRVVMTDGYWCIVFLKPEGQFIKQEKAALEDIIVFQSTSASSGLYGEIESRFNELFGVLDYHAIADKQPEINPPELPFYFSTGERLEALHGMLLKYVEFGGIYHTTPRVEVSPIVFLRRPSTRWFQVVSRIVVQLPPNEAEIPQHLEAVAEKARELCALIVAVHQGPLAWRSLLEHYADSDGFAQLPGVRATGELYLIVTGSETHYLRATPSVPDCPYHRWLDARGAGVQHPAEGPRAIQSTSPRVWFPNDTSHHCAHRTTELIKSNPVTLGNRSQCGTRSARDNEAFCEIRGFEQHLCCRTCVFEEVCEKSDVFKLPCIRPEKR